MYIDKTKPIHFMTFVLGQASVCEPSLKVCRLAYSEPVRKPRSREGCNRKGIWLKSTLGCMAGLTLALIFVAAACQLVVIQWETRVRGNRRSGKYKLGVITRRCLYSSAHQYLAACCVPVSTTASRQHLRSAAGHQLVILSHQLTTYGRWVFSVAGPMFWNSLPRNLHNPLYTAAVFGRSLKIFLFSEY